MYAGCIGGAIQKDEYLNIILKSGFKNIVVQKEKGIDIPGDILAKYLDEGEINSYRNNGPGIFSITVYGEKKNDECCDKETCCK